MTEIFPIDSTLVISKDIVPVAAYQAIYHNLTSKVEKISEVFPDAYTIKLDDLVQLDRMLNQATTQYPVQNKNSTCSISLYENELIAPSSFEKFCMFNFSMAKPTKKINYQFDFFSVLPVEIEGAKEIVQRFKVSINIDQDFIEDHESGIPPFMRSFISGNNINLTLEYSDYNVARNLQVTVQDWVKSLEKKEVPSWISAVESYSDFISGIFPFILVISTLFGISKWFNPDSYQSLFQAIFMSFAWAVTAYVLGRILTTEMYKQLAQARPLTFICLTKGDNDRHKMLAASRDTRSRISLAFISLILISIPVNIFSNWIFEKIIK